MLFSNEKLRAGTHHDWNLGDIKRSEEASHRPPLVVILFMVHEMPTTGGSVEAILVVVQG